MQLMAGGHLSAARSIKEYIENNYNDVEINLVDCIKYINKTLDKLTTTAYNEMAKKAPHLWGSIYSNSAKGILGNISNSSNKLMSRKLDNLLQDYNPDLIISTHPFGSQMCTILKKKGRTNAKIATVMTDYAPHDQWLVNSDLVDYFFVAHDGMKQDLTKKGILKDKIFATGIPLSNRFLTSYPKKEILDELGLVADKKTILFFAGR